jgi:hypothetical protein
MFLHAKTISGTERTPRGHAMPDPLSDVKSRLIDRIYIPETPAPRRDPFEAMSLHAAVGNELWWISAGRQTPLRVTRLGSLSSRSAHRCK